MPRRFPFRGWRRAVGAAWVGAAALAGAAGCAPAGEVPGKDAAAAEAAMDGEYERLRDALVDGPLARDITDPHVLAAMRSVRRHRFVPESLREHAYENRALPIGEDQTISQPSVVALMTQLLDLERGDRVLEVGTGSGYQAAVLAELGGDVYSIEILEPLARRAAATLAELGYGRVHLRVGDGYRGWPEAAPFQGILVTCAPDHIPPPLQEQLAEGGRLVIPVGPRGDQELVVVVKEGGKLVRRDVVPVRFVPMTGPGVEGN